MPESAELLEPAAVQAAWLDDLTVSALHLVAEALVELAGFGVVAMAVARDDGLLQTAVVCGSDEARDQLRDHTTPIAALYDELAVGDRWGRFTFVPRERLRGTGLPGWVGDYDVLDREDAWHPEDLLVALLHDSSGRLRASLAIDVPTDGRRPGPERIADLERFAAQAERAVVSALERSRLADQLRLADSAREIIRRASSDLDVSLVLERAGDALLAATKSSGLFLRTFTGDGGSLLAVRADGSLLPPRPDHGALAERNSHELWRRQQVGIIYPDELVNLPVDDENHGIRDLIRNSRTGSLLVVPLGAADECLGVLTFARAAGAPRWTPAETAFAFDLGGDLGQLLLNARVYEREQRLVGDLRELDDYKNRLITSVTEELRRPLSAIVADLDLIGRAPLPAFARRALDTMERTSERMVRLVEDLMLLTRVADPRTRPPRTAVDLGPIIRDVSQLTEVAAQERSLSLRVRIPAFTPVVALGDPVELDRVVVNLVNNAVKYTNEGGSVTITLRHTEGGDMVELVVSDDGIGISGEDQQRLFTEFFRSTNPAALARPGTGLGLTIVDRIVRRHGGRCELESQLGAGTTVRVLLPAAVV